MDYHGLHGTDELGRLSRAFDAMAMRVAATQRRLREDIVERGRVQRAVQGHGQEELRAASGGAEARGGEGRHHLGVAEHREGAGVPLHALLGREERLRRGVHAAPRGVVHQDRAPGQAAAMARASAIGTSVSS